MQYNAIYGFENNNFQMEHCDMVPSSAKNVCEYKLNHLDEAVQIGTTLYSLYFILWSQKKRPQYPYLNLMRTGNKSGQNFGQIGPTAAELRPLIDIRN